MSCGLATVGQITLSGWLSVGGCNAAELTEPDSCQVAAMSLRGALRLCSGLTRLVIAIWHVKSYFFGINDVDVLNDNMFCDLCC